MVLQIRELITIFQSYRCYDADDTKWLQCSQHIILVRVERIQQKEEVVNECEAR